MKRYNVKVSTKGQIVLPKELRDKFNIKHNCEVKVFADDEQIYIKPIKFEDEFQDMVMYCLKRAGKPINEDTIREYESRVRDSIDRMVLESREEYARGEYITLDELKRELDAEKKEVKAGWEEAFKKAASRMHEDDPVIYDDSLDFDK
ncbi:MAG: SpoVT / AbrB like domain protein [Firmicutes bacterium]|nr:SpoVT / AbrB like domain protein [Bacillota bacterium]